MDNLNVLIKMMILSLLLLVQACEDSEESTASVTTETGVFVDSAVANIGYRTETQQGITNASGEYNYIEGETVTFFIGNLEFPSVTASGTVTPLAMVGTTDTSDTSVVNIIRLIQTLDEDGDPTNGITITETAKSNAVQVDFSLSTTDFEIAVSDLVVNSGSTNTSLISESDAIANFEDTLVTTDVEFVANMNITGAWINSTTTDQLLGFVFFSDDTYAHMEVDASPVIATDPPNASASVTYSGMERGTFSQNNDTGLLTVIQSFDENGDSGLTDFVEGDGNPSAYAHISGDNLTLDFDENNNGTIDTGESLLFTRVQSDGLLGVWTTNQDITGVDPNALLAFIFFSDDTYIHLEVDEGDLNIINAQTFVSADSDNSSGMEWGTYSVDDSTGKLAINITFDANSDSGLTDFANGNGDAFVHVSGDTLTLQVDENKNGTIDDSESITFQRQ